MERGTTKTPVPQSDSGSAHIVISEDSNGLPSIKFGGPPGEEIHPHAPSPFRWEPMRNPDGSIIVDHKGKVLSVERFLNTKPLRPDLCTRPGPGNKKLTYMSGECVTRTLNEAFGFDGWCLEIKSKNREECLKDEKQRYHVAYTAVVRVTHRRSGVFKEDCGAGDAIDKNLGTAVAHAIKASITDAMKRAARHFGEKLGNSLYQGSFSVNKAPATLKDALDSSDIERAKSTFGFPKDRKPTATNLAQQNPVAECTKNGIPPPTQTSDTTKPKNLNGCGLPQPNQTRPPFGSKMVSQNQQQKPTFVPFAERRQADQIAQSPNQLPPVTCPIGRSVPADGQSPSKLSGNSQFITPYRQSKVTQESQQAEEAHFGVVPNFEPAGSLRPGTSRGRHDMLQSFTANMNGNTVGPLKHMNGNAVGPLKRPLPGGSDNGQRARRPLPPTTINPYQAPNVS